MPDNGPYVTFPLEDIELVAQLVEDGGDWVTANWIRSQAQEMQVEWERELNTPPTYDELARQGRVSGGTW